MYIYKSFASLYLETRTVKERLSCVWELSGNLQRELKNVLKNLNARIQDMETTGNSDLENLKKDMAPLEEVLQFVQKEIKMISENQREPEKSALDETTGRRARAKQVKFRLADRTKKGNGQKYGESQTREAAKRDGEMERQLLCDGKLILHKIV